MAIDTGQGNLARLHIRRAWWKAKIEGNKARDQMQNRVLRKNGWKVVRIWQYQLTAKLVRLAIRKLRGAGLIASPAGSNSKWGV